MAANEMTPKQRRKNIRVAWLLAGFAIFMFATSVPFWKGLFNMVMANAL